MPRQLFHEHYCASCAHLFSTSAAGRSIDVYRCGPVPHERLRTTILMRFSDAPSDYWSVPVDVISQTHRTHPWWRSVMLSIVANSDLPEEKRRQLELWLRRSTPDIVSDTVAEKELQNYLLQMKPVQPEKRDG